MVSVWPKCQILCTLLAISKSMNRDLLKTKDIQLRLSRLLTVVLLFSSNSTSFANLKCVQVFSEKAVNINEYQKESKLIPSGIDPVEPYRKYFAECIQGKWRDYLGQLIARGFETRSSNKEVLENVFGLRFGKDAEVPSTRKIIENYNQYMKTLVQKNVIVRTDVLRPAFFVKTGDKHRIIENPESIPEGSEIVSNISSEDYHTMLSNGFFPLSQTLLVHDLAHLTAFVSHPQYMAALKNLSIFEKSQRGVDYPSRKSRVFTVNENLVLVRPEKKEALLNTLYLTQQMRANAKVITLDQMVEHLQTRTDSEISDLLVTLANNFHEYLDPIGGGARDPYGSLVDGYRHINPIYRMITSFKGSRNEKVLQLAQIQIVLIRLSNTTMKDWFDTLNVPQLDPASPVAQLFADQRVWAEYPNQFHSFSTSNYSKDF